MVKRFDHVCKVVFCGFDNFAHNGDACFDVCLVFVDKELVRYPNVAVHLF